MRNALLGCRRLPDDSDGDDVSVGDNSCLRTQPSLPWTWPTTCAVVSTTSTQSTAAALHAASTSQWRHRVTASSWRQSPWQRLDADDDSGDIGERAESRARQRRGKINALALIYLILQYQELIRVVLLQFSPVCRPWQVPPGAAAGPHPPPPQPHRYASALHWVHSMKIITVTSIPHSRSQYHLHPPSVAAAGGYTVLSARHVRLFVRLWVRDTSVKMVWCTWGKDQNKGFSTVPLLHLCTLKVERIKLKSRMRKCSSYFRPWLRLL